MESLDLKIEYWVKALTEKDSQEALRRLYILLYPRLHSFIFSYVHSDETTEELVSDVFLHLWEKRKQLPEVQYFKSYLYTVARNQAISQYRKESHRQAEQAIPHMQLYQKQENDPETELITLEVMKQLNDAIETLPEKCRQTYRLVREHNLKYKEVSDILNISVKTIEAHMSLAIKRLREALSNELYK